MEKYRKIWHGHTTIRVNYEIGRNLKILQIRDPFPKAIFSRIKDCSIVTGREGCVFLRVHQILLGFRGGGGAEL